MAGLSAVLSKLKYLPSVSIAKAKGQQVSVVYFDEVDGKRVIDRLQAPNSTGVCVPRPCKTSAEWQERLKQREE